MTNRYTQSGFTLIELVVTILLAAICSLLAARLFVEAYRQFYSYRDRNAAFFAEYRDELRFRKLLHEHAWVCREDGSFSFEGHGNDTLQFTQIFPTPRCETNQRTGRTLICLKPGVCVPGK